MKTSTRGVDGAIKLADSEDSVFKTTFRADGSAGALGLYGRVPGKIECKDASEGAWICQRSAFLASEMGVEASIAFQKKLCTDLYGGGLLILQRISGSGKFFINGCGDFIERDLAPGETISVSAFKAVAWEESVRYDVKKVGDVIALTGPGKVIMQSMPSRSSAVGWFPTCP